MPRNSNRLSKIGKLGQSAFQTLCHNDGLTANVAEDDSEGWDYLVEWSAPASTLPADRAPRGVSAFVQVKATSDRKKRSCQVKLSNALRFAKKPAPCFTVLLVFAADSALPVDAYVSHFWERDIEQALAASRAMSVDGRPLHKETFAVRFDESDRVPVDQLLKRIEAAVTAQGTDYAGAKQRQIEEAGAEEQSFRINIKFQDGLTKDQLLNAMLGHEETLEASSIEVLETRFGVTAPRDDWSSPGKLRIEPKVRPMDLVITRPASGDTLRLPGQATLAQLPGPSGPLRRMRLETDFVSLRTDLNGSGSLSLKFNGQVPYTFAKLRGITRLSCWVTEGPVDVSLDTELGSLLSGQCEIKMDQEKPFWPLMDQVLGELEAIFPIDCWPPNATLTMADLADGWQTLSQFSGTLTQADVVWSFVGLDPALPQEAIRAVPAMQGVQYLDLGSVTLFAIYVAGLRLVEIADSKTDLTLDKPDIRYRHVLRGDARTNWAFMRDQVAKFRATLPPGMIHSDLPEDPDEADLIPPAKQFGGPLLEQR